MVYLDAKTDTFLEEVSSCNIFVVKGKTIRTPPLQVRDAGQGCVAGQGARPGGHSGARQQCMWWRWQQQSKLVANPDFPGNTLVGICPALPRPKQPPLTTLVWPACFCCAGHHPAWRDAAKCD